MIKCLNHNLQLNLETENPNYYYFYCCPKKDSYIECYNKDITSAYRYSLCISDQLGIYSNNYNDFFKETYLVSSSFKSQFIDGFLKKNQNIFINRF